MSYSPRYVIAPDDAANGWRVAANCRAGIREAIGDMHAQDKALEVRIGEAKTNRSLAQNRCFHGWMKAISDWYDDTHGERLPPEAWKYWFKLQYLGDVMHTMPGGDVIETVRETSSLTVAEFKDLLNRIDAWSVDQDGLELPRGDDYWEAMR